MSIAEAALDWPEKWAQSCCIHIVFHNSEFAICYSYCDTLTLVSELTSDVNGANESGLGFISIPFLQLFPSGLVPHLSCRGGFNKVSELRAAFIRIWPHPAISWLQMRRATSEMGSRKTLNKHLKSERWLTRLKECIEIYLQRQEEMLPVVPEVNGRSVWEKAKGHDICCSKRLLGPEIHVFHYVGIWV